MPAPPVSLNAELLLEQIRALGAVGLDGAGGGRTRIALTDADKAGRDLFVRWMRELALEMRVDRIGNVFGVLQAAADARGRKPLMIGSHIDTVRNAGALDGCYGVLAGLAVARAYRARACCRLAAPGAGPHQRHPAPGHLHRGPARPGRAALADGGETPGRLPGPDRRARGRGDRGLGTA